MEKQYKTQYRNYRTLGRVGTALAGLALLVGSAGCASDRRDLMYKGWEAGAESYAGSTNYSQKEQIPKQEKAHENKLSLGEVFKDILDLLELNNFNDFDPVPAAAGTTNKQISGCAESVLKKNQ